MNLPPSRQQATRLSCTGAIRTRTSLPADSKLHVYPVQVQYGLEPPSQPTASYTSILYRCNTDSNLLPSRQQATRLSCTGAIRTRTSLPAGSKLHVYLVQVQYGQEPPSQPTASYTSILYRCNTDSNLPLSRQQATRLSCTGAIRTRTSLPADSKLHVYPVQVQYGHEPPSQPTASYTSILYRCNTDTNLPPSRQQATRLSCTGAIRTRTSLPADSKLHVYPVQVQYGHEPPSQPTASYTSILYRCNTDMNHPPSRQQATRLPCTGVIRTRTSLPADSKLHVYPVQVQYGHEPPSQPTASYTSILYSCNTNMNLPPSRQQATRLSCTGAIRTRTSLPADSKLHVYPVQVQYGLEPPSQPTASYTSILYRCNTDSNLPPSRQQATRLSCTGAIRTRTSLPAGSKLHVYLVQVQYGQEPPSQPTASYTSILYRCNTDSNLPLSRQQATRLSCTGAIRTRTSLPADSKLHVYPVQVQYGHEPPSQPTASYTSILYRCNTDTNLPPSRQQATRLSCTGAIRTRTSLPADSKLHVYPVQVQYGHEPPSQPTASYTSILYRCNTDTNLPPSRQQATRLSCTGAIRTRTSLPADCKLHVYPVQVQYGHEPPSQPTASYTSILYRCNTDRNLPPSRLQATRLSCTGAIRTRTSLPADCKLHVYPVQVQYGHEPPSQPTASYTSILYRCNTDSNLPPSRQQATRLSCTGAIRTGTSLPADSKLHVYLVQVQYGHEPPSQPTASYTSILYMCNTDTNLPPSRQQATRLSCTGAIRI